MISIVPNQHASEPTKFFFEVTSGQYEVIRQAWIFDWEYCIEVKCIHGGNQAILPTREVDLWCPINKTC